MKDDKINNLKNNLEKAIKDADSIHETIMNKLDDFADTLKGVEISIAELPDKLTQRFDDKYASKKLEEDVNCLNEELSKMKEKNSDRNYEWLKYLVMLGIGALMAYFGLN